MKILSNFSTHLNERFGCMVAIPKSHDYGFLTKIFGEKRDEILDSFKNSSTAKEGRLISNVSAISFPTAYTINNQRLYLIDYTDKYNSENNTEISYDKRLPTVKFTKIEFETFALFHEIGHCLDSGCKYYDFEENKVDSLRWQRECFADFYATLMFQSCLNLPEFVHDRILPLRAISTIMEYQTSPAINHARSITGRSTNLRGLSERDVLSLAVNEWNKITPEILYEWKKQGELNLFNQNVFKGCVESGGITSFLTQLDKKYHQGILNNFASFLENTTGQFLANALHFNKASETMTKIQLCLMRPIGGKEIDVQRNKKYDQHLQTYLSQMPDCPLLKNNKICHNIGVAI